MKLGIQTEKKNRGEGARLKGDLDVYRRPGGGPRQVRREMRDLDARVFVTGR